MADRALLELVAGWLPHIGGRAADADWVAAQVVEYLAALPGPLRPAVGALGRTLSLLPSGSASRLAGIPGTAEYARLVRSLTTVVYLGAQESPA